MIQAASRGSGALLMGASLQMFSVTRFLASFSDCFTRLLQLLRGEQAPGVQASACSSLSEILSR